MKSYFVKDGVFKMSVVKKSLFSLKRVFAQFLLEKKILKGSLAISSRITVQKKIFTGFMVVIVLVATMSAFTYYEVGELNRNSQEVTKQNLMKIELVEELAIDVANETVAMRRFNFTGNLADVADFENHRKYGDDKINKLENVLASKESQMTLTELKTEKKAFDTIAAQSVQAKRANKLDQVALYMQQAGIPSENSIATTRLLIGAVKQHIEEQEVNSTKKADGVQFLLVLVSFLVAGISVFVSIFISRTISRPANVIAQAAAGIASGNLSLADVDVKSSDEIGELGISFNRMKASLRDVIRKMATSAEQVKQSSEQLTASADQSAQAASDVACATTSVAQGSEQQLIAIQDTSAAVQQLLASIERIASHADDVALKSEQAAETATTGGKAVKQAVSQMDRIENTVNTSAQVIVKLGEQSKQIGQIVDTIAGIAKQTNLLALNAAIEAARAGEHGRGFAVVAEEVRKLAEESQQATKEIAELISSIQGDTSQAVQAMSEGTNEVKVGADVVDATGKAFQSMEIIVLEVSCQIKEISVAIQEMTGGSHQIASSVETIDELSKKASEKAQTVSAATQLQSASLEEIAASSQELAKLSQNLQEVVNKFCL
uniref:methyl-accepting chemotaxis protein n=1 Tax=Pelorhabdus rhamnosifermentans TaxID=2772457 RepID=UPI001FE9DA4B|nr:HAMP domain-containing methyl-accepting chemotaxis protein [Pelorhabdus rhamnosifermentans]